jgi:NADH dehydrogenase (ubiquinone) 1 alpha/beta subcomplex 1
MFRTAIARSARVVAQSSSRSYSTPAFRRAIIPSAPFARIPAPVSRIAAVRCYAAGSGLNKDEVTGRILDLLKNFDKVRRLG